MGYDVVVSPLFRPAAQVGGRGTVSPSANGADKRRMSSVSGRSLYTPRQSSPLDRCRDARAALPGFSERTPVSGQQWSSGAAQDPQGPAGRSPPGLGGYNPRCMLFRHAAGRICDRAVMQQPSAVERRRSILNARSRRGDPLHLARRRHCR